jgi:hypothetical protein
LVIEGVDESRLTGHIVMRSPLSRLRASRVRARKQTLIVSLAKAGNYRFARREIDRILPFSDIQCNRMKWIAILTAERRMCADIGGNAKHP